MDSDVNAGGAELTRGIRRRGKLRHIEVERDLRVRFPTRGAEFDDGVEIGLAMARMAEFAPRIEAKVSEASVEQLRALARRLGYRLNVEASEGELVTVALEPARSRPRLRVVASAG